MYGITIDIHSKLSTTMQLCQQIRYKIETGELPAGTRLLPTRTLSKEWGIARNTVIEVYEQLTAEGYLDCRVGSGTYVAEGIQLPLRRHAISEITEVSASKRIANISKDDLIDFSTGIPDFELFPRKNWAKHIKMAAEYANSDQFDYGNICGDESLRTAICEYLFRNKGIRCAVEQLIIVSGSSEGLLLIAKSLSQNFRSIYIEDPTIDMTREIFSHMDYKLVPIDVDEHGMNVDSIARFAQGHLALMTPSHQFPTGSLLSVQRRQKAVRMAEEADTYLIEDDYDGEFRLRGIPVPTLYSLDPERVLYVGTFSKTLSPSLRIGFIIVPPRLLERVIKVKRELHLHTPQMLQRALSYFITEGHLERHIHKMKNVYKKRRMRLFDCLTACFNKDVLILGDDTGMHVHIKFLPESYRNLPWSNVTQFGIHVETIDEYRLTSGGPGTSIVLGYGSLNEKLIEIGIKRLHAFVLQHISEMATP